MDKLKKNKYIILALLFLIGFFYWMIEGGSILPDKEIVKEKLPNAIIEHASFNEKKDGKIIWEITADKLEIDSENEINILTGIKGKLFKSDDTYIDITAKQGSYHNITKELTLSHDVDAIYSEGWTLKCQEIKWTPDDDIIVAKGDVEFVKDDVIITGDQIETDSKTEKIKITGNGIVKRGVQK